MIDIALIPPGPIAAEYTEGRPFQMALAGVLQHPAEKEYAEFYFQAWKSRSATWMLDNGAWEGERVENSDLIRIAHRYGATEMIAPDILRDPYGTMELTTEFLATMANLARPLFSIKPNIAVVAHGRNVSEALAFVTELNTRDVEHQVKTISISRTVCYRSSNPTARYELALEIKSRFKDRYEIHLLGLSDEWPTELQHCVAVPGLIRSLDTAAPFTFAAAGVHIDKIGHTKVPRPDNYFQLTSDFINRDLLDHNIKTLDRWGRSSIRP